MRAMVMTSPGQPLAEQSLDRPTPGAHDVLVQVKACDACRTDLHVVDGELPNPKSNVIPGHEIVGEVVAAGALVTRFGIGERIGIPWLGLTCGHCNYCRSGRENLCDAPSFTGYTRDGRLASAGQ